MIGLRAWDRWNDMYEAKQIIFIVLVRVRFEWNEDNQGLYSCIF